MTDSISSEQLAECAATFREQGYVKVPGAIPQEKALEALRYVRTKANEGYEAKSGAFVPGTYAKYGDQMTEGLLEELLPVIEQVVGRRLYPTYSFCRYYKHGDILQRHRDRPSCEFSLTLCIGAEAEGGEPVAWPIYMNGTPVSCAPADMAVYRGCEIEHWRDPYEGRYQAQAFLHYVDRDQPYGELLRFDGRSSLVGSKDDRARKRTAMGEAIFWRIHKGESMLGSAT